MFSKFISRRLLSFYSIAAMVFGLVLLFTFASCEQKKSEPKDRELSYNEMKNDKGQIVKIVVTDKKTNAVVQVRSWEYDSLGNVLLQMDDYKEDKNLFRNEYQYQNNKLSRITRYKNDTLIATEEFDGTQERPTKVVHIENGEEVIREITKYAKDQGEWIYQLSENKLEQTKKERIRRNQQIYEKKWLKGVLQEMSVYNKFQRAIQEIPLIRGHFTIIAFHTYEESNRNSIKETKIAWYDNPKKIIDNVYPIKKEKFGVEDLDPQMKKGVKVKYWKRSGQIELKSLTRSISMQGKPLW